MTPGEKAEQDRQRASDQLAEKLSRDVAWGLYPTLLWIAHRDTSTGAGIVLMYENAPDFLFAQPVDIVSTWLSEPFDVPPATSSPHVDLLTALERRDLTATGLRDDTSVREEIPRIAWRDLTFARRADVQQRICATPERSAGATFWADVEFDPVAIRRVFPQAEGATIGAETRATKRLSEIIAASPSKATHTKAELRSVLNEAGILNSGASFNRSFAAATTASNATAWKRGGRPPKTSTLKPLTQ